MAPRKPKSKTKKTTKRKSAVKKPAELKTAKSLGNVTSVKELERLARLAAECRDRSQTASGKIGGEIKAAADTQHLHPKAFRAVLAEIRLGANDPIKLRSYLDACEYYRDALKVEEMAAGHMTGSKKTAKPKRGRTEPTNEMKPVGDVATNVVSLAGEMQKAIKADEAAKGAQSKGEMEAAVG